MILILSQSHAEHTTDLIVDWLVHLGVSHVRLNGIDLITELNLRIEQGKISFLNLELDFNRIKIVWFRRWITPWELKGFILKEQATDYRIKFKVNKFLGDEIIAISSFFLKCFRKDQLFEKYSFQDINKLELLKVAGEIGLKTPVTLITTENKQLTLFRKDHSVITKAITQGFSIDLGENAYTGYTSIYNETEDKFSKFGPGKFQEKIIKKFEIRTFIWDRKIWSMAIFSQLDEQTAVDFRHYNNVKPNRFVPYTLCEEISKKLIMILEYFGLKSGSFDLIMNNKSELILLELNPEGQFGMVSIPCNYHIEEYISKYFKSAAHDMEQQNS